MKKKKTKKFTLKEGEKVLVEGDEVLYMANTIVDKTSVASVVMESEFPYALLKNGIRVGVVYEKKSKELKVQGKDLSSQAYVWGKKAKDLWESYQLKVRFNKIQRDLSKVEFTSLDKSLLIEILPLLDNLLNKKENE